MCVCNGVLCLCSLIVEVPALGETGKERKQLLEGLCMRMPKEQGVAGSHVWVNDNYPKPACDKETSK